jgi:ribosome-associated protein
MIESMKQKKPSTSTFELSGKPHIPLYMLMKFEAWSPSGGAAKHEIDAGKVRVDGEVELRRRCKIVAGQVVEMGALAVNVVE